MLPPSNLIHSGFSTCIIYILYFKIHYIPWIGYGRFLRRKQESLSEYPSQEIPFRIKKQSRPTASPSVCISQSVSLPLPNGVSTRGKKYKVLEAANASNSVIESLSVNPSQYQFKKQSHKSHPHPSASHNRRICSSQGKCLLKIRAIE